MRSWTNPPLLFGHRAETVETAAGIIADSAVRV
jgi:hypothetical protein